MHEDRAAIFVKWAEIWKLFDKDEQRQACKCLVEATIANPDDDASRGLRRKLAEATKMRPSSLDALLRRDVIKATALIQTRAAAMLDGAMWHRMFVAYYCKHKSDLLCMFLDRLGVSHDGCGLITEPLSVPPEGVVRAAGDALLQKYSLHEVIRYLTVLLRTGEKWAFLSCERERLLQMVEEKGRDRAAGATRQAEAAADSSMEFNVLDRVLIEQIVRSAMRIEGALDEEQVEELIDQAIRLNEKWYRSYFHLGFMDVLLPNRALRFEHPGDNEVRRGWYLAGVIAGMVRGNDMDGLNRVLDQRATELMAAVGKSGGPGAAIARTAFRPIAEQGRSSEAVAILRGQLCHVGDELAEEAVTIAARLIHQSKFETAKSIVDELLRQLLPEPVNGEPSRYWLELSRRRAQCLQAAGDFDGAEHEYLKLLNAGEKYQTPELLGDVGLVKGRFRSLTEVRLLPDTAARAAMRDSLARGEHWFSQAYQRWGDLAPKAAYCLAVLSYLKWTFAAAPQIETLRERAAALAGAAVDAMLKSEFAGVYRAYGVLGQAQFIFVVMRLHGMEDTQGREAAAAWQAITDDSGRFPLEDMKRLVEALDFYSQDIADPIAESIWDYRRDDALAILRGGSWMTRSPRLRAEMVSAARREVAPRAERFQLWLSLVPILVRDGDGNLAVEGLGELEVLAATPADIGQLLSFLEDRGNYDPVWKEADAALARMILMRRLGRDEDCAQALRQLFYQVRDSQRWLAEQIVVMAEEWNLGDELLGELRRGLPRGDTKALASTEEKLRAGAVVKLLFVGGNEIQARYDEVIADELVSDWPGVRVEFDHSGWSSNWGRDLDRLIERANAADAVVLMHMMRTLLGRRLREALKKPWVPCTATGKVGMLLSLRRAAQVAIEQRENLASQRQ
jgi:tetratricopeptide (TPR) repeat protein